MVLNIRTPDIVPHFFWIMDWNDLNNDEKDAWKLMGYDENSWMNNSLLKKNFYDYTLVKQIAINKFGFKDYMWDTSPVIEFDIIEHYRNLKWDDLNRYQKELFNSLSYYPHNWNKSSITKFSDFSYKLKVVIEFLGFNEETWDIFIEVGDSINKNVITGVNNTINKSKLFNLASNERDLFSLIRFINRK